MPTCHDQGVRHTSPSERQDIQNCLATCDLFQGLDEGQLLNLERELEFVKLNAGDVLMRQNEIGDSLFVMLSGRLRAFIERDPNLEVPVGEISPGEIVGEMAIISDDPRSATVRAVRPSALVRLGRAGFERLESEHPQIVKAIAKSLVRRLKRTIAPPRDRRQGSLTIGFVAGTPDTDLQLFMQRFESALAEIGPTCLLSPSVVDAEMGRSASQTAMDSDQGAAVTSRISELERRHRFVLYEADKPDTAWSRRVVRNSDRIFIVVSAENEPPETGGYVASSGLNESVARKDLLLLHSSAIAPISGTARWREVFNVDDHYHVRFNLSRDYGRLARIVSGNAVGLVLGGGGARSFAHIGVIRALTEAGVPIDFVGGTSVGAVIAAECSMDWTPQQMLEITRETFGLHPLYGDHAQPIISGVRNKSFRLFERLFGDYGIEDQWRTFFCVSCSLTRGEAVVHRSGRFHDCVEASSALPILNTPVFDSGDVLVDGALINNLPADIMQNVCGGKVIAVDVSSRHDLRALVGSKDDGACGSRIIRSGARPTSAPSEYSIAMRTIMLNSVISADAMKRNIDLYLKPPVDDIEMFDWASIEAAADAGYRYAAAEIVKAPLFKSA